MGGYNPIHDWLDVKLRGKKGAMEKYRRDQAAESRAKSKFRRRNSRSGSRISDDDGEDCYDPPPPGGYGRAGMGGRNQGLPGGGPSGLGGPPGMGNSGMTGVGLGSYVDMYGPNRMAALVAAGAPVYGGRAKGGIIIPSMPADASEQLKARPNLQYNTPAWGPNNVARNQPPQMVPLGPPQRIQNQPPPPPPFQNQQGVQGPIARLQGVFPPRGQNQQNNGRNIHFASPPPYTSQDPFRSRSRSASRDQTPSQVSRMQGQSNPPQQNQQAYNPAPFGPPQEQSDRSSSRGRSRTPARNVSSPAPRMQGQSKPPQHQQNYNSVPFDPGQAQRSLSRSRTGTTVPIQTRRRPVHAQTAPAVLGQPGRTYIEGFATQPE